MSRFAGALHSELPAGWDDHPLVLIKRTEPAGALRSVYRVGLAGDTRVMLVELDAKGKLLFAIILAAINWRKLADRNTTLLDATPAQFQMRLVAGIAILLALVPTVWIPLQHTGSTEILLKGIGAVATVWLLTITFRHRDRIERDHMWAFLILAVGCWCSGRCTRWHRTGCSCSR